MTVENAVKNNGGKNMSYNEFLPSYSIGDDCYKEIPYVTRRYGKPLLLSAARLLWKRLSLNCLRLSKALTLR